MTRHSPLLYAVLGASLSALAIPAAMAQSAPGAPATSASSAGNTDNTGVNRRDRSNATLTPGDQPNDRTDIKLAAAVRKAIMRDKSLSMKAHNVKLIAASGVVTLRGPVASDSEKARVESDAAAVHGVTRVDNQLDSQH